MEVSRKVRPLIALIGIGRSTLLTFRLLATRLYDTDMASLIARPIALPARIFLPALIALDRDSGLDAIAAHESPDNLLCCAKAFADFFLG